MGLLSALFHSKAKKKALSADDAYARRSVSDSHLTVPRISVPHGVPCRSDGSNGTIPSAYITSTRNLAALQYDHVRGRIVAVKEEETPRAQSYRHADLLEAFDRWGKAPIKVQQEIEQRVRNSEPKHCEEDTCIEQMEGELHEEFARRLRARLRR